MTRVVHHYRMLRVSCVIIEGLAAYVIHTILEERMKVTIIGAGNTGTALAVHMASLGLHPLLYTRSAEKARSLSRSVHAAGSIQGDFHISATTDFTAAVHRADLIVICTWANTHRKIFEKLFSHRVSGYDLLIFNGNWGAYEAVAAQRAFAPDFLGCISETSGMPYAASASYNTEKHSVTSSIAAIKSSLTLATACGNNENVLRFLRAVYARIEEVSSVFETSLSAPNPIIHVPLCLLNMSKIEQGQHFHFLVDGFSERAEHLVHAIDNERTAIAGRLNAHYTPILEVLNESWNSHYPSLVEIFRRNPVYSQLPSPTGVEHRFIQEDVPYGIAPLVSLGALLHVDTKTCESLLTLYSTYFASPFPGPVFGPDALQQLGQEQTPHGSAIAKDIDD